MEKGSSMRWETSSQLKLISNCGDVYASSKESPSSLFVILFNEEIPRSGGIEMRFKNWQKTYENAHQVQFYKCIISEYDDTVKNQFKIKDIPTLIFIRNGSEIGRIDNLDESNPRIADSTPIKEETADEKRVKQKLDELCK